VGRFRERPVVITDATMSLDEERHIRIVRYVWMMSIRAGLVVLCGVLFMLDVPLLWLWITLGLVGMAVLPWLAVLLANDRIAKQGTMRRFRRTRRAETLEAPRHRMIDSE
jgi:hypothetical protein